MQRVYILMEHIKRRYSKSIYSTLSWPILIGNNYLSKCSEQFVHLQNKHYIFKGTQFTFNTHGTDTNIRHISSQHLIPVTSTNHGFILRKARLLPLLKILLI